MEWSVPSRWRWHFLTEQPTTVRINTERITKQELIDRLQSEGVRVSEAVQMEDALFLSGYDYLNKLKSFQEGLFLCTGHQFHDSGKGSEEQKRARMWS